jgi:hypothetical protein
MIEGGAFSCMLPASQLKQLELNAEKLRYVEFSLRLRLSAAPPPARH